MAPHQKADDAHDEQQNQVEGRVVEGINPKRREHQNAAVKQRLRNGEQARLLKEWNQSFQAQ